MTAKDEGSRLFMLGRLERAVEHYEWVGLHSLHSRVTDWLHGPCLRCHQMNRVLTHNNNLSEK